jgi:hypothetical protein
VSNLDIVIDSPSPNHLKIFVRKPIRHVFYIRAFMQELFSLEFQYFITYLIKVCFFILPNFSHILKISSGIRLNDKPWFNSEIRKEIRTRNRLHKLARRNQSNQSLQKYKSQRNKVNNMIKYFPVPFIIRLTNVQ